MCHLCKPWHLHFYFKKYLHYLLKQLLLKKIWDSPQFFKIKCHTVYCQELLHTLFLKARLGDLHTNFPIKPLSKGKDSCHADRQLTKQFYCFFWGREWEKQGKTNWEKPIPSTTHTQITVATTWTFPGQPNPGDKTEIWAHFKDFFSSGLKKCLMQYKECDNEV